MEDNNRHLLPKKRVISPLKANGPTHDHGFKNKADIKAERKVQKPDARHENYSQIWDEIQKLEEPVLLSKALEQHLPVIGEVPMSK